MMTRRGVIVLATAVLAASCHLVTGIDGAEFEPVGQGGATSSTGAGASASSAGGAPATSSSSMGGNTGGGGSAAGGGGFGTGGVDICGHPPHPPPPTMCPPACTQCNGSTCVIECDPSEPMKDCSAQYVDTITCPPEWDCEVSCTGDGACSFGTGSTTVICPEGHTCEVQCNPSGSTTCDDLVVQCASQGPCQLGCDVGNGRCDDAELRCGDSDCALNCTGSSPPPFKPTATCPSPGVGCACDDQC